MNKTDQARMITRRTALAVGTLAPLLACSSNSVDSESPNGSNGGSGASPTTSAGAGGGSADGWASGGTASMTGKNGYPDPFTDPLGDSCMLTPQATAGPCYASTSEREDISEDQPGLPVRLALMVVDAQCQPVANAVVDVWHTNYEGIYSGDDSVAMCTGDDVEALASHWFRGTQTTGGDGKVFFDSCFPGWYQGRAIHIHFQVRIGNQAYSTSQLYFAQGLVEAIFSTHPTYAPFGQPDTSNTTDGIYLASGELATSQMTDGAMLAYKVLTIPA